MAQVGKVSQLTFMTPELLKAAIEGNEQILAEMLGLRLDQDRGDQTAVYIKLRSESECLKHLQSTTFVGNTVLHVLCSYGHDVFASKVCKKDGSLLRAHNQMLETPLHCAAIAGQAEIIKKLVEFARSSEGEVGLKEMLRERNRHGVTALHEAARRNHEGIINELMKVDPELAYEVDDDGRSAMHVAIDRGDNGVVASMTAKLPGHKIEPRIDCSQPNQLAVLHSTSKNAGITQKTKSVGISTSDPICRAVLAGNTHMVKLLLDSDSSLAYSQDSDGLFPIHIAARNGDANMVLLFMERYLDSGELVDHRGRNFLHVVAEYNISSAFTELLLKLSHNIPFRNKIKNMFRMRRNELFEKLNNRPLLPIWKRMLARMINATDNEGNTPLHVAVEKKCTTTMRTLMKNNTVDLDLRNRKGLTPFDISVIKIKESPQYSVGMQNQIEKYIQKEGAKFTFSWIMDFMPKINKKANMTDQIQIIGLGAVLITTVTFAAAFTLPGGYNAYGFPVLIDNGYFQEFILADVLAFIESFFCVVMLMYGGLNSLEADTKDKFMFAAFELFHAGSKSTVLAFTFGLLSVLPPGGSSMRLGLFILGFGGIAVLLDDIPAVVLIVHGFFSINGQIKPSKKRICYELAFFTLRVSGPFLVITLFPFVQ